MYKYIYINTICFHHFVRNVSIILSTFGVGGIVVLDGLDAGSTIRRAAGVFGWTTPLRVAEAVVQAVEYDAQPQTFAPTRWAPDPVISRGP